jgi:hypothetical protein
MFILFRAGDRSAGWAIAVTLLTITVSFGFAKVHDGTMSILFPLSRMFLAVPLLLGWGIARWRPSLRSGPLIILGISLVTFSLRYERAGPAWTAALTDPKGTPIYMMKVSAVRDRCRTLEHYALETAAEAIVVIRPPSDPGPAFFMNMGCPVCGPGLPPTYMPDGDRRTWRVEEESRLHRERILMVNGDPGVWAKVRKGRLNVIPVGNGDPVMHLVVGAGLPVDSLMLYLGFQIN